MAMEVAGLDVELAQRQTNNAKRERTRKFVQTIVLFVLITCVRALHPTVVTASKTRLPDGSLGFAYQAGSPVILKNAVVCACCLVVASLTEGSKGLRTMMAPKLMLIFGINGAILAFDDWLEMVSLSKMSGSAYQIIMQSKILITAFLMMPLKGVYQTRIQWLLLCALVASMSVYVVAAKKERSSDEIPFWAYLFTVFKVTCSCVAGVYTDRFTKDYNKVISLNLQILLAYFWRLMTAIVFMSCSSNIWTAGFFQGWDILTAGVTVSFCIKGSLSYIVVALLDAIAKHLAECVAVMIIFWYEVLAPWVDFQFDTTMFLAVVIICLLIGAYVESKQLIEKAAKYDETQTHLKHTGLQ